MATAIVGSDIPVDIFARCRDDDAFETPAAHRPMRSIRDGRQLHAGQQGLRADYDDDDRCIRSGWCFSEGERLDPKQVVSSIGSALE